MSTYIKLSTLEFPRYPGDIAIDPDGAEDYAVVEDTDRPAFDEKTQRCYQIAPIKVDGVWRAVWEVSNLTAQEIEDMAKPPQERFPHLFPNAPVVEQPT